MSTASAILLIVDDEAAVRSALQRFLTGKGYDVLTAANAAEAVQSLRKHKISGLLLDVRLPDVSGVDLVPQLLDIDPNVAIVMLTAVNDAASATLSLQRGAMEYLTKPVDLSDLGTAIERALRKRREEMEKASLNH